MLSLKSVGAPLAALGLASALFLAAGSANAAMAPSGLSQSSNPDIQLAFCALGLRVGPLGGCIAGGPGPYARPVGPGPRRCWINAWGRRVCNY